MFMRVIQSTASNKDKQEYLEMFYPKIIKQLSSFQDAPIELLVECLAALNLLTEQDFHSILLLPRQAQVIKCAQALLSFRKRVVRKFARVVINSWA